MLRSAAAEAATPSRLPVVVEIGSTNPSPAIDPTIIDAVRRTWGYDTLRPMQAEAIGAALADRDSLVVMPTGGGKSLCYQVPPLITGKLSIVVSPLIALMKDQVDGLRLAGYPAAALNSHVSQEDAAQVRADARSGALKLLFIAPERLLMQGTISWLASLGSGIGSIAIDEAHCISQWGHDFRPEYRRLAEIRQHFPRLALHAYTATATPRVRADIVEQLGLHNPAVLVGCFDRPNLTYRVLPRTRLVEQCLRILGRHKDRAAIIYCISRKDTESLAASLTAKGVAASAYHAGMTALQRAKVQSAFRDEKLNVVCATVAFGMGIDRGDVRCVIHAAMPKTVESYQQETGRAGRDGLPAECVLLHGPGDYARWKRAIEGSAAEAGSGPEVVSAQLELLNHMRALVGSARCRHRALSEYFGQKYSPPDSEQPGCAGCDHCLNELDPVPDSTVVAQKILSCVFRVGQSYGIAHVADVLVGAATARVTEKRHNELSTFGLLRQSSKQTVRSCIHQLLDQGALEQYGEEYPVLRLGPQAKAMLKGELPAALFEPRHDADATEALGRQPRGAGRSGAVVPGLSAEEAGLFESLRELRRTIAGELGVPPFVVFADTVLEEMCRVRPGSMETLMWVRGIGRVKLERFGERFLSRIMEYCRDNGMKLDATQGSRPRRMVTGESSF